MEVLVPLDLEYAVHVSFHETFKAICGECASRNSHENVRSHHCTFS